VAPPELAEEIVQRNKGSMSSLDAIDPDTGNVDMQRYLQAQSSLVTAIANETRSDAVLEVKLMKVRAKVRTSIASWDDMTEPVASKKTRFLSPVGGLGGEGWAYAATADMALWNKNGMLLWKKRRGFALLAVQSGMGVKYHERPLTEVYANRGAMQRWLDATLAQLTPSHRGTTAGPSALSPEIQEQIDKAKRAGEKPE